eukprot:2260922-Amphidinium_carterae.1
MPIDINTMYGCDTTSAQELSRNALLNTSQLPRETKCESPIKILGESSQMLMQTTACYSDAPPRTPQEVTYDVVMHHQLSY